MSKGRRKNVKTSQNTYSNKSLFCRSYGVTQIIILCIYNANVLQCQNINFVSTYKKEYIVVYAQINLCNDSPFRP